MSQEDLWTKFESNLHNEGVTKKRINKLHSMFRMAAKGLGKNYNRVTRADIENFVDKLHRGAFRKEDGTPYSGSTESDLKKFIKQFYKWLRGDNEFYPREVSWIKTRISKDKKPKEKAVIEQEQVLEIIKHFRRPEYQVMTLLLFDSGFRISEMFSVRKKDLSWESFDDDGNCCWWISCNESKTYARKVDVGLFTEQLSTFANTVFSTGKKAGDKLFNFSDTIYRRCLRQAAEKVLGKKKKLTPHALRHSSATLYASIYSGDRIKLAERYGWSYSCKELDTYVRRASNGRQKQSAKIVYQSELHKIKKENELLKSHMASLDAKFDKLSLLAQAEARQRVARKQVSANAPFP